MRLGPLAFLLALISLGGCHDERVVPARRLVIVISIDTLRPERLGVYGNDPSVSPSIDALARESVVFDQALSTAPWTLPSHMSMMTGLDPLAHGVRTTDDALAASVPTLAESLHAQGFATAGFTDGGLVSSAYGFDRGFDVYHEPDSVRARRGFGHTVPRATSWLDENAQRDVFLFLHSYDVHAPYTVGDREILREFRARPTPESALDHMLFYARFLYMQRVAGVARYRRLTELLNDYDAGIHEADRAIGSLLDHLRRTKQYDDALIVVLSDHGESFFDHDLYNGHGLFLTDDEIRIPCIVKLPHAEGGGRRIAELVDLLDLYPTVLDVAGVEERPVLQGESWLDVVRGMPRRRTSSFAESHNAESCSVTTPSHKYIAPSRCLPLTIATRHLGPETPQRLDGARPGTEYVLGANQVRLIYSEGSGPLGLRDRIPVGARLFDRHKDPRERDNLAQVDGERREQMESRLETVWAASTALREARRDARGEAAASPEHHEHLRALGYVGSAEEDAQSSAPSELALDEAAGASFQPPGVNIEGLRSADREVHRLRFTNAKPLSEREREVARTAAIAYATWGLQNPEWHARAEWRLRALADLCENRGSPLDPSLWTEFDRWLDAQPKMPGESK
jgi:arylsulfatase A-like enzyme